MKNLDQELREVFREKAQDAGAPPAIPPGPTAGPAMRRSWRWMLIPAAVVTTAAVVIPVAVLSRDTQSAPLPSNQGAGWVQESCSSRPAFPSPSQADVWNMNVVGAGVCRWVNPSQLNSTNSGTQVTVTLSDQERSELIALIEEASPGNPDCAVIDSEPQVEFLVLLKDYEDQSWQITIPNDFCLGFELDGNPYQSPELADWLDNITTNENAPTPEALSTDTLERMHDRGIRAVTADPDIVNPNVSQDEALANFARDEPQPSEMSLTTVTVDNYLDRSNQRIIDNRTAWVALTPNVDVILSGPIQGSEERPSTYKSDMVVIIDATTGETLRAETID